MNTINNQDSLLLIIDVQEKLVNMLEDNLVKDNAIKIAKACGILEIPTVITEQYPKGLGSTIEEIRNSLPNAQYVEKTTFSALKEDEVRKLLSQKQVIIFPKGTLSLRMKVIGVAFCQVQLMSSRF